MVYVCMGGPYFGGSLRNSILHGTEILRTVPACSIHNMITVM
jgi:hypothetical protein